MKSIYITGMSGTGKSTIIKTLKNKGFTAIDTDYGDWKELSDSDGSEWILKENRIKELLSKPLKSSVFISGCCSNQPDLYPLFDHIVLLSAPIEILLERISDRTSNPYGKTPGERNEIIWNYANIQPLLKEDCDFEFDTTLMNPAEITASMIALLTRD